MRNKYEGKCYRCGKTVPAGEGHFEAKRNYNGIGNKWLTQHASCAIEWRGKKSPFELQEIAKQEGLMS